MLAKAYSLLPTPDLWPCGRHTNAISPHPLLPPLFQNVRHLPRVKFHLCSLERLTVWVINLVPERGSSLLPTVEMTGPGASRGTVFQGDGARKIKPGVSESGWMQPFFIPHHLLQLLCGRNDLVTQRGQWPSTRAPADYSPAEAAAKPALTRMLVPSTYGFARVGPFLLLTACRRWI